MILTLPFELYRYNQGWRGCAFNYTVGHTAEVKVGFAAPTGHNDDIDIFFLYQLEDFFGRFTNADVSYVEGAFIKKFFTDFVQP